MKFLQRAGALFSRRRLLAGLWIGLVLIFCSTLPAAAAGSSLSIDAYRSLVDSTRLAVQELQTAAPNAPADGGHARLVEIAFAWESLTSVELSDGARLPVSHTYIVHLLRQEPPDLHALDALLAQYQSALDPAQAGDPSPASLEKLKAILKSPEFQAWQQQASSNQWLQDLLDRLNRWLAGLRLPDTSLGVQLAAVLLSLVLAGILVYFLLKLRTGFSAEAQLEQAALEGQAPLTAHTALRQAQVFSGDGDFRSAVRYLYLSTLLLLDERGLLRYDRFRTNHEVLQTLQASTDLAPRLEQVIQVFDRVWYGYQPLDAQAYREYEEQIDAFHRSKPA